MVWVDLIEVHYWFKSRHRVVPALQGVGMDEAELLACYYSSGTFLALLIVFILRALNGIVQVESNLLIHLAPREVTSAILEVDCVQRHDTGVKLGFNLVGKFLIGIAVDKAAFLLRVPMQVAVIEQPPLKVVRRQELLDRVDGRLPDRVRVIIEAIQILIEDVHPIVPMIDPVGVDHRDELEHKVLAKDFRTYIFPIRV